MKNKKIFFFFIPLLLSLAAFLFQKSISLLVEPIFKTVGICESYLGDYSCYHWSEVALLGFVFLFLNIVFISIFLFFIQYDSFARWCKFSKFGIPVTFFLVLFLILSFKPSTGGFFDILSFDSFPVFIPSMIFTFISLIILFTKKDTFSFRFFTLKD